MRYRNALQQIWTWVLSIAGLLVLTIALPSLSIWVVLMTGIVSLIAVLHPLPRLWLPTRKKAGCVLALSFGLLAVGGAHLPEPPPATPEEFEAQAEKWAAQAEVRIRQAKVRGEARRRTEAAKKRPAAVIQAEANAARTQAPAEAPPTPEGEWNVHEFKVVEDEDTSFGNRLRRSIRIVAPTALTREDRIATLIEAARQAWRKHHSQFIALFLLPFESGPIVARIDYAPDKCGVSGEDCTGQVWTAASASDVVLTPKQEQIHTAWERNKDRFNEIDKNFGFETVNEERLKTFLADQFDTTPEEIFDAMLQTLSASAGQQEMTIPHRLELLGHLSDHEQKEAEEKACRASLQCWGDKHSFAASFRCPDQIERLAKYDHEWTDGWLGTKFSRFAWKDRQTGAITYIGDQIKFQNGFGAWVPHTYHCDFDPIKREVLDVRAMAGRLQATR